MDKENFIKVTGVEPKELVKAAYALSSPMGLGFLHAKEGELSDEDAAECFDPSPNKATAEWSSCIVHMDYVHGRCCKLYVFKDIDGDLWIKKNWYDHSRAHVEALLKRVGA